MCCVNACACALLVAFDLMCMTEYSRCVSVCAMVLHMSAECIISSCKYVTTIKVNVIGY